MNINSLGQQPPIAQPDSTTQAERKARLEARNKDAGKNSEVKQDPKPENLGTLLSRQVANAAAQKEPLSVDNEASEQIPDNETAELRTSQLVAQLRAQTGTGALSTHYNLDPERVRKLLE